MLRSFRDNGRTWNDLDRAGFNPAATFNQSTPERRSALLLVEGSQPMTFNLWQEVRAYFSRSTSC